MRTVRRTLIRDRVPELMDAEGAVAPNAVGAAQRASRTARGGFARRLELGWVERG
ncbi:MAG: hypothetical protein P1P87_09430 [Trueperaceae bacterium]|nr:hypothetical protein [Trueperaceae bacterium]